MEGGGRFVSVKGTRDGVGKLVEVSGTQAEVHYFVSPAATEPHRVRVATTRVERVELAPQTRVYWFDDSHQAWRAGRVDGGLVSAQALRTSEDHYHVRFPNGLDARVPESRLFVRWSQPIEEPTDYLAARITDTPFFFEGRARALHFLTTERAAFGGLSALASGAVELLEHQVTCVRQVLSDPIERYLLADEVGLGKTIEAGILIRQHIIDSDQQAKILVVCPKHLVEQWKSELLTKFYLSDTSGVTVASEDAVLTASVAPLSMLVVDEAHRSALRAFANDARERRLYECICELAIRTPRLLLLSGTPVLHREDGFLAMLHLLDPEGYPLDEREAFRRRVQGRQAVAEAVADLSDDASPLFLEDAVSRLEELFVDDPRLLALCSATRALANASVTDESRLAAIRSLRIHVGETYKLHRRLLRTRRDDARVRDLLPRRMGTLVLEHDDQARRESADLLETWRALRSAQEEAENKDATALFAVLVEAALSHPRVLLRVLEARVAALELAREPVALPAHVRGLLGQPAFFDEELTLLKERKFLIEGALKDEPRADRLAEWLEASRDVRKVVVFVDDEQVANNIASRLQRQRVGPVLRHEASLNETAFSTSDTARVLVCDASAEEGLNLQRIGATVVHYDLPLDPARIEQRIGRVDRIEAQKNVQSVTLTSGSPYEQEWLTCLCSAVGVFERSVSPLQYVLVDETTRIRAGLIAEGPSAIVAAQKRMRDERAGLDTELRRIRAQESLDSVEVDPEHERAFFDTLQEADAEAEESGESEFNAWVIDRLQFGRRDEEQGGFRYVHCGASSRRPTLVPLFDAVALLGQSIDRQSNTRSRSELPFRPVTFERTVAEQDGIELLRVGHPFFEGMEALIRADDRGAAFAMWRHLPKWRHEPRLFFRFDFIVDADLSFAREAIRTQQASSDALRRRVERGFPADHVTVWIDSDLEEVRDDEIRRLLELPYVNKKTRSDGGLDLNLRLERWTAADQLAPTGDWSALCTRARSAAEAALRRGSGFQEKCAACARRSLEAASRVSDTLRARIARLDGPVRDTEERGLEFDAQLAHALARGMEAPTVRVDSVGAIYLSAVPLRVA